MRVGIWIKDGGGLQKVNQFEYVEKEAYFIGILQEYNTF